MIANGQVFGARFTEAEMQSTSRTSIGESLESAITHVLTALVVDCRVPPPVFVALGPAMAQLKRLVDLPPVSDADILQRLIQGNPDQYFLRVSGGVRISITRIGHSKGTLVSALSSDAIAAVASSARTLRLRTVRIMPAEAALARVMVQGVHPLTSDEAVVQVRCQAGVVEDVERSWRPSLDPSGDDSVEGVSSDGEATTDRLLAQGATMCVDAPLALRLGRIDRDSRDVTARYLSRGLLVASLVHLAFGPVIVARTTYGVLRWRSGGIQDELQQYRTARESLAGLAHEVESLRAQQAQRVSAIVRLANLTNALPDNAYLRSYSLTGDRISLETSAASVADLMPSLRQIEPTSTVLLNGEVRSDTTGGERIEHARVVIEARKRGGAVTSITGANQ